MSTESVKFVQWLVCRTGDTISHTCVSYTLIGVSHTGGSEPHRRSGSHMVKLATGSAQRTLGGLHFTLDLPLITPFPTTIINKTTTSRGQKLSV